MPQQSSPPSVPAASIELTAETPPFFGRTSPEPGRSSGEEAGAEHGLRFPATIQGRILPFTILCGMGAALSSPSSTYRAAFFDLDGTLLNGEHSVSPATRDALRSLHERGVTVCIATGRSAPALFPTVEALGLPEVPVVCYNGGRGMVCGVRDGKAFVKEDCFSRPLSESATAKAVGLAKRLGLVAQYYAGDDILVDRENVLTNRYRDLTGVQQVVVTTYEDITERPFKVLVMCGEDSIDDVFEEARGSLGDACHAIRGAPPFFVELLEPGVNKGDGVVRMAAALDIPIGDVVAFGDGDNDQEMLRLAGHGVAMKNARPVSKAAADAVTQFDNTEDGVARHVGAMLASGAFPPGPTS